jgi:predicted hydrocarbon binding protein
MNQSGRGLDLIQLPARSLGAVLKVLRDDLGEVDAARVIRQIGLDSGAAFHELFRDWLSQAGAGSTDPESLDRETFWRRLSDFFTQLGWGRFEFESAYAGVISLQFVDWVEARQDASGSGCHFTAGVLAEMLRQVAGGELAALELASEKSGDGEMKILIGNPDRLDSLFSRMREGSGYEDALKALA